MEINPNEYRLAALYHDDRAIRNQAMKKLVEYYAFYEKVWELFDLMNSSNVSEHKKLIKQEIQKIADKFAEKFGIKRNNGMAIAYVLGSISYMEIIGLFHSDKRIRQRKAMKVIDAYASMQNFKRIEFIMRVSEDAPVRRYAKKVLRNHVKRMFRNSSIEKEVEEKRKHREFVKKQAKISKLVRVLKSLEMQKSH